jgi:hypothetical protein
MRAALAKVRRARVLGRTAVTLEPAYAKALAAREGAERTSACLVLCLLVFLVGGRRVAAVCAAAARADQGRAWLCALRRCAVCVSC